MRVMIISVKAGYGHHSTAKALMDCFEKRGIDSVMLDTFDYINTVLGDSIDYGYMFSTKHFPEFYGKAYTLLDKRDERYEKASPIALLSKLISHRLKDYINEFKPDVIIGTHSFACMVITVLKERGHISCPTIGIVTDFTVHPFWESTDLDFYVTADSLLDNQMRKKGIPKEKILPYGIPIKSSFSSSLSKQEARKKHGLDDKMTILVMMGSMGFGNIEKSLLAVDKLDLDFQIVCVCGKNEKMKKGIDSHTWNKLKLNLGFVDYVNELMDAADLIITKPGGLTTSELLAKRLPAIIMNPIPGQEDRNVEFLVNNGAAVMATNTFGLDEAIFELLSHSWRLRLLKISVTRLGKPHSTETLCNFVEKHLYESGKNFEVPGPDTVMRATELPNKTEDNKLMKKLCIFDLDGTLSDTMPAISYFGNAALAKYGFGNIEVKDYKLYVGDGRSALIHRMLEHFNSDTPEWFEKVCAAYDEGYEGDPLYKTAPYDGIIELLDELKSRGVKIAVLTNKPQNVAIDVVKKFFGERFDLIIGQREGIPVKPDPQGAFDIMQALGMEKDETVFIGDTNVDIRTGKSAGVYAVGVLWGFRDEAELLDAGADKIISHPSELIDVIS